MEEVVAISGEINLMMGRSAIIWRVKSRQKAVYSILQKQNVAFNVICLVLVPERFKPMHARFFLLIFTTLWAFSCRPSGPEEIPLPTKICLLTSHHGQPIPRAKVWIKYNTDTFPGYQQPPSFFDASFETGADADTDHASFTAATPSNSEGEGSFLNFENTFYRSDLSQFMLK